MLVGGVVGVNDPGLGGAEDLEKLVAQGGVGGIRGEAARVAKLDHRAVTADPSRFDLFFVPPLGQFLGLHAGKCSPTVGAGDSSKPLVAYPKAFDDSVKGHKFEVVGVRPHAKMGDALEAFGLGDLVGHEQPTGEIDSLRRGFRRNGHSRFSSVFGMGAT